MNHDFWLDAMLKDANRRRAYQLDLLAAKCQTPRPRESIKRLLDMASAARASEYQAAARLRQSYGSAI